MKEVKIVKYGEVVIREDEILVQNFTFDCNGWMPVIDADCGLLSGQREAIDWARKRLEEKK